MARLTFRTVIVSAALAISAIVPATLLSGCTAPEGQPQAIQSAPPPVATPVPLPPAPVQQAVAPTPMQAVTSGRAKVALLVPLSGPNSSVGQAMLDAANMALFDVSTDIALLPRDTGSTPESTAAAASRAVSDGAGLILGPVFAGAVPPVRDVLNGSPVSAIVFSTDATVAGGNVFVMGFLPALQVDRVVGFAKSRGMTKLAALVPDNAYGVAVTAEIQIGRAHV